MVLIKKATLEDVDYIVSLYNDSIAWLDNQGIHQWKKDIYPTRKSALNALREGSLYNCIIENKHVGTFIIDEHQAYQYEALNWKYKDGKVLVLHTLVIKPEETGRGLAKAVLEFVIEYARANNYTSVRLDVFPDNKAAVRLYLSYEFEFAGKVFFDMKELGYEWYDCYEKLIKQ